MIQIPIIGTSNFGIADVPLPEDSVLINQLLWGSIGWSVGRPSHSRTPIHPDNKPFPRKKAASWALRWQAENLVEDEPFFSLVMVACNFCRFWDIDSETNTDGIARQLTAQELSTLIRTGVKPIIFLLNNSGYTIERCIRGKNRSGTACV